MRHPLIFAAWVVLLGLSAVASSHGAGLFVLVFLSAPILALVTLASVGKPFEDLELAAAWRWPYRLVFGALVAAGLAGVSGVASGLSLRNTPIAILFLFAIVFGWRALIAPSPKRAAYPAALLHVSWIPLLIANFVGHSRDQETLPSWQLGLALYSGLAILGISGIASMLTAFVFTPAPPSLPPARVR